MISKKISTVDIRIGTNLYGKITDFPSTPSHTLAEFIDNALQSFRDKQKELLHIDPNYSFRIDISFLRNTVTGKIEKIIIEDNAGGLDTDSFERAFQLAISPENNQGLNEFGMGLKTASLWLGEIWKLTTSAIDEDVCRTVTFDLNKVLQENLNEINVASKYAEKNDHFTRIEISSLTDKAPSEKTLPKIKDELSSIYRKSLRENEANIYFDGERLSFEEVEILVAPPANNLKARPIKWRKDIDFKFGKYHAKGFIGLLKDINSAKNGIVLLRRGRVVHGEENDGRYFPKSLCGSVGTFRYKRIFGEFELEGFNVTYNKNNIQNKEDLEALMEAIHGEIHTKEFDLFNQADDYRLDDQQKRVNRIVKKHNEKKKKYGDVKVITLSSTNKEPIDDNHTEIDTINHEDDVEPVQMGKIDDEYNINGKKYKLVVEMVDRGNDLVWLDTSHKEENIVTCKINMSNEFFQYFNQSSEAIIALLKTLALAKFMAKENGNDSTGELFNAFNAYIKETKV